MIVLIPQKMQLKAKSSLGLDFLNPFFVFFEDDLFLEGCFIVVRFLS